MDFSAVVRRFVSTGTDFFSIVKEKKCMPSEKLGWDVVGLFINALTTT